MKNKKNPVSPAPRSLTVQKPYLQLLTPTTATLVQLRKEITVDALRDMVREFAVQCPAENFPCVFMAKLPQKNATFYVSSRDRQFESVYESECPKYEEAE